MYNPFTILMCNPPHVYISHIVLDMQVLKFIFPWSAIGNAKCVNWTNKESKVVHPTQEHNVGMLT